MKYFILLAYWQLMVLFSYAQNTIALPAITSYSKQEYKGGTQNWDMCQDAEGRLYFANNEGLLVYDGTFWKLYALPNKTIVRSVAIGNDKRIYVGGQDEMGYFVPDKNGALLYHSLTDLIPAAYRSFADIWDIIPYHNQLFFRANERIFHYTNNKILVYRDRNWLFMGSDHEGLIAQDVGEGILRYKNGVWSLLFAKNLLPAGALITGIVPTGDSSSIFTTLKHGMYKYSHKELKPVTSSFLSSLKNEYIYAATPLKDSTHFIAGTNTNGAVILTFDGKLVQRFSRKEGLQNNNVLSVFTDKEQNIWLGLDNGIDYIAYNSPVKHIFPDIQNDGSGYAAAIHGQQLFIGTSAGIFSASLHTTTGDLSFVKADFSLLNNSNGQVWNISAIDNRLLIGHHEGAFEYKTDVKSLDDAGGYWQFLPLPAQPSLLVAGTYNGLSLFSNKEPFPIAGRLTFESSRFLVVKDSSIWISHPYKGIYKVVLRQKQLLPPQKYGESKGLAISNNGNYIFMIKQRLVVTTENGIFEYNAAKDIFEPSDYFNRLIGQYPVRYMREDIDGNVWFVYNKNLAVIDFSGINPEVQYINELNHKLVSGFEYIYPYNAENIFIGAEKGFIHFNYTKYKEQPVTPLILINQIKISGSSDSIIFNGFLSSSEETTLQPIINYNQNSISFSYASPVYDHRQQVLYSVLLDGHDSRWSEWTTKTDKEFTYLTPGRYAFLVKSKLVSGQESEPAVYIFIISPPWYLSWWAYCIYALSAAVLLFLLYRQQQKKFKQQQKQFEERQQQLHSRHQLVMEKNEKEIISLKNEKLEAEIQHKNTEMASATMHLVKKGELISRLKEDLGKLSKNSAEEHTKDAVKKLMKTLQAEDKTDEDWEHFTLHFDKTHNDFFLALKAVHTNLTASELKLCAYLRMNLSTKEIAQLLNISVRGVEISRYRLRKKLAISTETSLYDYLIVFNNN